MRHKDYDEYDKSKRGKRRIIRFLLIMTILWLVGDLVNIKVLQNIGEMDELVLPSQESVESAPSQEESPTSEETSAIEEIPADEESDTPIEELFHLDNTTDSSRTGARGKSKGR